MPARALSPATLRAVALHLLDEPPGGLYAIDGGARQPTVGRVRRAREPDDLIGTYAEPSWRGVALLFAGAATHLDTGDRDAVVISLAISRVGTGAVALRVGPGEPEVLPLDGGSGFLLDVARRILGLPTEGDPPREETLITSQWLAALLDRVADPTTAASVRTWPDAVALHPLVDVEVDGVPNPDELVRLVTDARRAWPWERLHRAAATGDVELVGVTPDDAAWMDWPFFARWILSVHRPVAELVDDLSLFCDGATLRGVRYVVEALGWLGFAGCGAALPTGDE